MKQTITASILLNGISLNAPQQFLKEKDFKAAVNVLREQLRCKVTVFRAVRGHYEVNIIDHD